MGRTSKFLFPIPGRKSSKDKEKERERERESEREIDREKERERERDKERERQRHRAGSVAPPPKSSSGQSIRQSKAQRILGTDNDLNIDSPTHSDAISWVYPSSTSSAMSISISESTHSTRSTADTGSFSGSNLDQWDRESGVFPRRQAHQQIGGKASSTILGQQYGEDAVTDTSSINRRMRHETSDSTLKSYYDRQKSSLLVSQQTSESSARDLALRKGHPPILRTSLSEVASLDQDSIGNNGDLSRDKTDKKKPARLDLSKLFPRSKRSTTDSSSLLTVGSQNSTARNFSSGRRKLTKVTSRESLQSQKQSIHSTHSNDQRQYSGYDTYDQPPLRSAPMTKIPESRVPDMPKRSDGGGRAQSIHQSASWNPYAENVSAQSNRPKTGHSQSISLEPQTFSWKNVRSNMGPPPADASSTASLSAASFSSRNTKTSRHTSNSAFSQSDLKQSSVLSLSSDSEEENSEAEQIPSPVPSNRAPRLPSGNSQRSHDKRIDSRYLAAPQPKPRKHSSRKSAVSGSSFLPIPEAALPNPRISGPWSPPDLSISREPSISSRVEDRQKGERRSSQKSSLSSRKSTQYSTPPSTPASLESQEVSFRSSRLMAVTKQEEQLLEALRQKRARMKQKIIEEHEIAKSPPRTQSRKTSQHSEVSRKSSVNTVPSRDASSNKEQILLYLDTPLDDVPFDAAEPSPDLSDFLSFGSDEDSTPRSSWLPPPRRQRPRVDSTIRQGDRVSPMTPPSAVRLSAVGTDFQNLQPEAQGLKKRNANIGVRFVEDPKANANSQDFLLDEHDSDGVWGM